MVQDAGAIDVVERAKVHLPDIEQRSHVKCDVRQTAHFGAGLGDLACRLAEVEVDDPALGHSFGHLLGQHDGCIAGAAACDQGAEGVVEIEPAGEHIMIDLVDVAG